jgi:hypothetical protein
MQYLEAKNARLRLLHYLQEFVSENHHATLEIQKITEAHWRRLGNDLTERRACNFYMTAQYDGDDCGMDN